MCPLTLILREIISISQLNNHNREIYQIISKWDIHVGLELVCNRWVEISLSANLIISSGTDKNIHILLDINNNNNNT